MMQQHGCRSACPPGSEPATSPLLQEDKLCGINIWQHCLLRRGMAAQWQQEVAALEEVYASGHVFAWWAA